MNSLIYNFDEDDFEFEVDLYDGQNALITILAKHFNLEEKKIKKIVEDLDLFFLDYLKSFEEEFKEYFEEEARQQYQDEKLYNKDKLGFYGMNIKDFI